MNAEMRRRFDRWQALTMFAEVIVADCEHRATFTPSSINHVPAGDVAADKIRRALVGMCEELGMAIRSPRDEEAAGLERAQQRGRVQ